MDSSKLTAEEVKQQRRIEEEQRRTAESLFPLACASQWTTLMDRIKHIHPDIVHAQVEEIEGLSLLHTVLCSSDAKVPLEAIKYIVDRGSYSGTNDSDSSDKNDEGVVGTTAAMLTDNHGDTPLHKSVYFMPERHDIAAYLVQHAPASVLARNRMKYLPIDLLSNRIIMQEEVAKYSGKASLKDKLERMWQTVLCLTHSSRPDTGDCQPPLIHSCLVVPAFPDSLLHRAVQRYPEQLRIPNQNGDLPLHLAAMLPPPVRHEDDDAGGTDTDDGGNDNDDVFIFLFIRYKEAALVLNHQSLSPLALAIQHGHGWESGTVRSVLDVCPTAVGHLNLPPEVLPFLLGRLVNEDRLTALYGILLVMSPS
jgi:hypothetical protein